MSDFRKLNDHISVSPQITVDDLSVAAQQGFTMIVNNRPEGESADQTDGTTIEAAARDLGLDYRYIPITHDGFTNQQVDALNMAIAASPGPVLAYCRSGTRSTLLWSLGQAKAGRSLEDIGHDAAAAGYDLGPVMDTLEMLAERADD